VKKADSRSCGARNSTTETGSNLFRGAGKSAGRPSARSAANRQTGSTREGSAGPEGFLQPKWIRPDPWKGYRNPPWHRVDKDKVTILYNFVERRKSFFMRAYFARKGYKFEDLGDYFKEDVRWGKEFGNRMECNPMYFTCGSLLKNLFRIHRETGLSKEEISRQYVFVGGGGQCGPCRYGMYPQEYWKALNDAGFTDFRLFIFTSGFSNEDVYKDSAFKFDTPLKINMVISAILADLMHAAECALRPYAEDKDEALKVIEECEEILYRAFRDRHYLRKLPRELRRVGKILSAVPRKDVVLPQIYVTGEIFANLAHNEGNYNLRRFIMDDGCEVMPGLFTQRMMYDFWRQIKLFTRTVKYPRSMGEYIQAVFMRTQSIFRRWVVLYFWKSYLEALDPPSFGGKVALMDLDKMAEIGFDYYHPEIFGGEGNLEIAEALYYADKMDGFISSKPFGCMPSSGVSDGVMAKVMAEHPDLNFLSIETSGDNEVSILSRVSMLLFKAKQKVARERIRRTD
jgi:predicted nucleotide-binding protein (sugar kinase/HSP70/actin superfamily)